MRAGLSSIKTSIKKVPPWSAVRFRLMRGGLCQYYYSNDRHKSKGDLISVSLVRSHPHFLL